jgi:hypothetical protein
LRIERNYGAKREFSPQLCRRETQKKVSIRPVLSFSSGEQRKYFHMMPEKIESRQVVYVKKGRNSHEPRTCHAAHLFTLVLLQPYNESDTRKHELSCINNRKVESKVIKKVVFVTEIRKDNKN